MKRRKKFALPETEVNVVPLMDILTSMLFFMVLMVSFSKYSSLLALSELLSSSSASEKKPRFDLVVSIKHQKRLKIHLGPINKLRIIDKQKFEKYLKRNFRGGAKRGFTKVLRAKNLPALLKRLKPFLIRIKKAFPHEMKSTLVLGDRVNYQQIINLIGGLREISQDDESFILENFLGQKEKSRVLFPEVALQELVGR